LEHYLRNYSDALEHLHGANKVASFATFVEGVEQHRRVLLLQGLHAPVQQTLALKAAVENLLLTLPSAAVEADALHLLYNRLDHLTELAVASLAARGDDARALDVQKRFVMWHDV
jgi:hypothetical protein